MQPTARRFVLDYAPLGHALAFIEDPNVPAFYRTPLAVYNKRNALYALPAAQAHTLIGDIHRALQFLYDAGAHKDRRDLLRRTRTFRAGGNITGAALYNVVCTLASLRP